MTQFSRELSHDLLWENKIYMLKTSIKTYTTTHSWLQPHCINVH